MLGNAAELPQGPSSPVLIPASQRPTTGSTRQKCSYFHVTLTMSVMYGGFVGISLGKERVFA